MIFKEIFFNFWVKSMKREMKMKSLPFLVQFLVFHPVIFKNIHPDLKAQTRDLILQTFHPSHEALLELFFIEIYSNPLCNSSKVCYDTFNKRFEDFFFNFQTNLNFCFLCKSNQICKPEKKIVKINQEMSIKISVLKH